jgi:beta-galactosidase
MWDGWVDVEHPRAHINGHWNYAPGTVKPVTVVSSANVVKLYLNGKYLGEGRQSERFLFTFDKVEWQPGELKAVGFDAGGRQVCEDVMVTAGKPAALRLTPIVSPNGLRADGADVALVQVEVVDALGRRNPVALDMVDFDLQGPAEWRGGIAQGPNNYILARSLPVEGGVNRVLVRTTPQAGKILVRARAAGLAPAELALESTPVKASGGLAALPPALPLHLERGPTPATSSFTVSSVAVPVAAVDAASKSGEAGNSIDDDETTKWTSEPGQGAAITYRLARPAQLTEAVLKLSGWRERSYPLLITVDGVEVYKGTTPKSLGYVHLPLKPHKGSAVRIALEGSVDEANAIKLTEVANQANADTGANNISKAVLAIVEAEFHERP